MADELVLTSKSKKKHHVRKVDGDIEPEFQIAPMIDILLVLLVFFMSISTTEVLQSNQNVKLAVAKDAKEAKKNPGQVIVNVLFNPMTHGASLEIDERPYSSPGEIVGMLRNKVAVNPNVRVLVRTDREIRWDYERALLEAVASSGVPNVTFSVVNKDQPK